MAQYRYATENLNYEDYAAGRVLVNHPGATSFPVRLASEIFQHCDALLDRRGAYRVYDPCCGTGYLLTVMGFLHGEQISEIQASDIDPAALNFAQRNLALLSPAGLEARIHQLEALRKQYGKESHAGALASAYRLAEKTRPHIMSAVYAADATRPNLDAPAQSIDLLITDVPYGQLKHWQGEASISALLAAQSPLLRPGAIAAIITLRGVPVQHRAYHPLRRFHIGKRQITLLQHTD